MLFEHYGLAPVDEWPTGTFVLQGVPPYFFGISGTCLALSERPLPGYLGRLLAIFCAICGCNVAGAFVERGFRWDAEMWSSDGVVFVGWYVAGLLLSAVVTAPGNGCLR